MQVASYFENIEYHGMRTWRKITIGNMQMCRNLEELLNNRSILVSKEEDSILVCSKIRGVQCEAGL